MKKLIPDALALVIPELIALAVYPILPATIPIHFSVTGRVDSAGKWVVFLIALIPFIVFERYQSRGR